MVDEHIYLTDIACYCIPTVCRDLLFEGIVKALFSKEQEKKEKQLKEVPLWLSI